MCLGQLPCKDRGLLIQLFFIYYGLPSIGITMDNYTAAYLGIGLCGGAALKFTAENSGCLGRTRALSAEVAASMKTIRASNLSIIAYTVP